MRPRKASRVQHEIHHPISDFSQDTNRSVEMSEGMHHNKINGGRQMVENLRAEGENSRADFLEALINEALRLRQRLWDVAKICGADTDGNDTPAPLDSDIVGFAMNAATDLRKDYNETIGVKR